MTTATNTYHDMNKINSMIHDQLSVIASIIPYIQQRQQAAMYYDRTGDPHYIEYIKHINRQIIKLLTCDL